MKERPIIFSCDMVIATLNGKKNQIRRIINPPRGKDASFAGVDFGCPYGVPGDELWVKEAFRIYDSNAECACYDECTCYTYNGKPIYRADTNCDDSFKWNSSVIMPRWASRISLIIKSVCVEHLNHILEPSPFKSNHMVWVIEFEVKK